MSGIFLTYTWYGKWVDIFQVYVGIFQTYRPSGQIYGIFQEYVRISNFYGFQMVCVWRKVTGNAIGICVSRLLGRTTICWGTGSGRPRGSFPSDRIAGMDIIGVNLGLLTRNMSAV
jgi:hypothetical protein